MKLPVIAHYVSRIRQRHITWTRRNPMGENATLREALDWALQIADRDVKLSVLEIEHWWTPNPKKAKSVSDWSRKLKN